MDALSALVVSFFVSCAMLFVLRPIAEAVGLVDKPGGRKTHHGDIPVVGGIAMFSGLVIASLAGQGTASTVGLLAVATFMVVLGGLDDRFNLPPRVRLFAHLAAAVTLMYAVQDSVGNLGDLFGFGPVRLGFLAMPFTAVAIVALVNGFNMLDGLDGLAGTAGFLAFGSILLLGQGGGTLLIAGSMFGAITAFLVFNLPMKANSGIRTFMGDAGSTLLGFIFAGLALKLIQPAPESINFPPVLVLWLVPIPIFEVFTSTVRRLVKGLPPSQADVGHYHHTLVRAGFSVRAIWIFYALFSLASCLLANWAWHEKLPEPLLFGAFVALFGLWVVITHNAAAIARLLPVSLQRLDTPP
jgi:UDP-GlcNAc:undecaprenyl-phosphate GlcNAc-1-phosphate transferase